MCGWMFTINRHGSFNKNDWYIKIDNVITSDLGDSFGGESVILRCKTMHSPNLKDHPYI